ncbi:hypothetical protein AAMO2058_001754700 [Amorphochlora amoebiformis]
MNCDCPAQSPTARVIIGVRLVGRENKISDPIKPIFLMCGVGVFDFRQAGGLGMGFMALERTWKTQGRDARHFGKKSEHIKHFG